MAMTKTKKPAKKPAPAEEAGGRAVTRKRGAWTKDEPYTRKDGTATRGTTIYLPVELAERLRRFAFEQDRKQNAIITEAIEAYLAERERDEARAERDARPDISAEDAAAWVRCIDVSDEPGGAADVVKYRAVNDALRAHAAKAVKP